MSLLSLLNIIPELYSDKIERDLNCSEHKMLFDEFFLFYMKEKFKLKKIIHRNCEETIYSIIKHSQEDDRIDLARRFLGIGDEKLRGELLDIYFIILKSEKNFLFFRFACFYIHSFY